MRDIQECSDTVFLERFKKRLAEAIKQDVDKYILTKHTVLRLLKICEQVLAQEDDKK